MRRSWFASLNLAATLLLFGILFIMVNWLASRRALRWDLTQQKLSQLSDQTLQALTTLEEPVRITVFYQPNHPLYELMRDLLEEYRRVRGDRLQVEYVDPDQDLARARLLVRELAIEELNLLIVQADSRQKRLSDTDLVEYDYTTMATAGEPRVKAFKGEDAVTSAIVSVTRATSPRLWFTSGHGERSLEDQEPGGLSALARTLEQQNLTVEPVNLLERGDIPDEVTLVVITGPTRRFTDQEVGALGTYLDDGGRLLAFLDPMTETALEPLFKRWGIVVGQDIVVDPANQLPFVSAANLFVTTYTQHPIVQKMSTLMTLFPLARSIRPQQPPPEGVRVVPLALTSSHGWGETRVAESTFEFAEGEDLNGPVPIAVAAEHLLADETAEAPEVGARLVVFGDSDFVVNGQLPNVGNRDLLLAASHWLLEEEQLIGISPKPLESLRLNLTAQQLLGMLWLSLLAMPLVFGLLGTATWWIRRK